VYLVFDELGIVAGGMLFVCVAACEGGLCNGILMVIEDFVAVRDEFVFASVLVFFGVGFVWDCGAFWVDVVVVVLVLWDCNLMFERLEVNCLC